MSNIFYWILGKYSFPFLSYNLDKIFNSNIESKNNDYNHYICSKCYKFPYIKFCKDRINIKLTCSCVNNKKISIEELFKKFPSNPSKSEFLPSEKNINIEKELMCKEHNKKFKGFSKFFLNNYCEECRQYKNEINNKDIIRFDDIKIEEKKIEELIKKIKYNNDDISEEKTKKKYNNNLFIIIKPYTFLKLLEEKDILFKKLINIIINDYKNYPNYSHFFNIKNLFNFFNIEDISKEKKGNIIDDDNLNEKNEPIIIEYINNVSNRTKLFSETFVKNNKEKFLL